MEGTSGITIELPQSLPEGSIHVHYFYDGYTLLIGLTVFLLLVRSLVAKKEDKDFYYTLYTCAFSLIPMLIGLVGAVAHLFEAAGIIACEPEGTISDAAGGLYIALQPLYWGLLLGGTLFVGNVILAIRKYGEEE